MEIIKKRTTSTKSWCILAALLLFFLGWGMVAFNPGRMKHVFKITHMSARIKGVHHHTWQKFL